MAEIKAVSAYLKTPLYLNIKGRADDMGVGVSTYVVLVLRDHIRSGRTVRIEEGEG